MPITGASRMMKIGLIDWSVDAGISIPKTVRSVRSRAKRFSDEPACSKPDQKTAMSRKSQKITAIRLFSRSLCPPKNQTYRK